MFIKSHNFYCSHLDINYVCNLQFKNETLKHIKYKGLQSIGSLLITIILGYNSVTEHTHVKNTKYLSLFFLDNIYSGFYIDENKLDKKDIAKIKLLTN